MVLAMIPTDWMADDDKDWMTDDDDDDADDDDGADDDDSAGDYNDDGDNRWLQRWRQWRRCAGDVDDAM